MSTSKPPSSQEHVNVFASSKESVRRNSGHMISVAFHLMMIRGESTQTVRHTALARPMRVAACGHTPPTSSRAKHSQKSQTEWQPNRLGQFDRLSGHQPQTKSLAAKQTGGHLLPHALASITATTLV